MLPWDDLQSFLAIARHGTLSAAARALGVRQTTMGRRLLGLEARAGARLLTKTPGGYVLTPAGEAILGHVERIEAETLAVERRISGRDIRLEGVVRVTTLEILAVEVLTPALARLQRDHPGIALEISAEARSVSLTRREADIALRLVRLTQNDLAVRKVGDLSFGIYASAGSLERHGPPDFLRGAPGHGQTGGFVGDIDRERDRTAALTFDQPDGLFRAREIVVCDPNLRARLGEAQRERAP